VFSRSAPQQAGQISPLTPGQRRLARFLSQILQETFTGGSQDGHHHRIIGYMARMDLYLKVELDLDEKERPDRVATEICRAVRKIYGVRQAEVSSIVEKEPT
jgi:hypothetical protein